MCTIVVYSRHGALQSSMCPSVCNVPHEACEVHVEQLTSLYEDEVLCNNFYCCTITFVIICLDDFPYTYHYG